MSDRATLLALAERVEMAKGPDRVLDGEIWKAITPGGTWHAFDGVWHMRDEGDHVAFDPPPEVTGSLDEAVWLLPDGCFISGMGDIAADGLPGCFLCISTDPVREVCGVVRRAGAGHIETLARAVAAAALRARAAMGEEA